MQIFLPLKPFLCPVLSILALSQPPLHEQTLVYQSQTPEHSIPSAVYRDAFRFAGWLDDSLDFCTPRLSHNRNLDLDLRGEIGIIPDVLGILVSIS